MRTMFSKLLLIGTFTLGVFAQRSGKNTAKSLLFDTRSSRAAASSTVSAETTVNVFLGPRAGKNIPWEGSIVAADACETVYELVCTEKPMCQPAATAVITNGHGVFQVSSVARPTGGGFERIFEICSLDGTATASCVETLQYSNGKTSTSTVRTKEFSGKVLAFQDIPITAGASKLNAGGTCSSANGSTKQTINSLPSPSGSLTSATTASAGAAPTMVRDVYKVLVVHGAAALLAGALA